MADQQRIGRAVVVKRHVGVPQPVALAKHHAAVVRLHDVAVGVEIADIDQRRIVDALAHVAGDLEHRPDFDRPEQGGEGNMLLVGRRLVVAVDDDAVFIDRRLQFADRQLVRRRAEIDAANLGGETRLTLCQREAHGRSLGCCWRSARSAGGGHFIGQDGRCCIRFAIHLTQIRLIICMANDRGGEIGATQRCSCGRCSGSCSAPLASMGCSVR